MNAKRIAAALLRAGLMTFTVTGLLTLCSHGFNAGFTCRWLRMWLTAWPIAFALGLFVLPRAARALRLLRRAA